MKTKTPDKIIKCLRFTILTWDVESGEKIENMKEKKPATEKKGFMKIWNW